jgi:hypothetical protein
VAAVRGWLKWVVASQPARLAAAVLEKEVDWHYLEWMVVAIPAVDWWHGLVAHQADFWNGTQQTWASLKTPQ